MRKQETVHICTALTLSKRGFILSLELAEQALTQEGYQHTSVYAYTDSVSCNLLSLILWVRKHVMGLNPQLICGKPSGGEIFSKAAAGRGVYEGGKYEQV